MQPATPHHRHQSSLEGILDFSQKPPLSEAQYQSASLSFRQLINYFDNLPHDRASKDYDRVKLVRFTFEYARSQVSQGNFLRAFFETANIPLDGEEVDLSDADRLANLKDSINNFADYLFESFFLPRMSTQLFIFLNKSAPLVTFSPAVKASTRKTPQPSPATHSAVQKIQGGEGQTFLGTPERLSTLRALCLFRDRHRCVVSRSFDDTEAIKRMNYAQRQGSTALDDDEVPFGDEPWDHLEVAHILPHSLTRVDANKQLVSTSSSSKLMAHPFF